MPLYLEWILNWTKWNWKHSNTDLSLSEIKGHAPDKDKYVDIFCIFLWAATGKGGCFLLCGRQNFGQQPNDWHSNFEPQTKMCHIVNAAAKQFTIFFRSVSGRFVEWLLVADSPRKKSRIWLTFKHKRTSVESGAWSGAQQASCGHNRPPASQITDRWGMQGEKKHLQLVLGENVFLIFSVKWWWQEPARLLIWYRWAFSVMEGQSVAHLVGFYPLESSRL